MIIFLFCQEIRVLRFWSFTFLEVKILKLGFFAQIKKWSWDNFKFQSIIMDILWGFHQKMGEEGECGFSGLWKILVSSAKFQIWKNLWIQNSFSRESVLTYTLMIHYRKNSHSTNLRIQRDFFFLLKNPYFEAQNLNKPSRP